MGLVLNFTDKKRPGLQSAAIDDHLPSKRLRSSTAPLNWKEDCLLCAKPAIVDSCHSQRQRVHRVSTIPMCYSLLERCRKKVTSGHLKLKIGSKDVLI